MPFKKTLQPCKNLQNYVEYFMKVNYIILRLLEKMKSLFILDMIKCNIILLLILLVNMN